MKTRIAVQQKDLTVDQALPFDIFDESDRLLVRHGMKLHSEAQLKRLISIGAFRYEHSEDRPVDADIQQIYDLLSPFEQVSNVEAELRILLEETFALGKDRNIGLYVRYARLVEELMELCEYDIDAIIGAIHTDEMVRYRVTHPLHCAILCYIVGKRLKLPADRIATLLGAALTANAGMYDLQEALSEQNGPLSKEQRLELETHPLQSVKLLKRAGITNKLWLEIVAQHHEQTDGRGYPRQLRGSQFIKEARIIAMADRYHAMISPRRYRKGLAPTQALKQLFQTRGKDIDDHIGALFIKELGIYPPGTYVRLKNGETAIVTRRGKDSMRPKVKSLLNSQGSRLRNPISRNCIDKRFEILGLCPPLKSFKKDLRLLWDYKI